MDDRELDMRLGTLEKAVLEIGKDLQDIKDFMSEVFDEIAKEDGLIEEEEYTEEEIEDLEERGKIPKQDRKSLKIKTKDE